MYLNLKLIITGDTAQKMKFSIKDFFSKCDQVHRKLRIWSHLLKRSITENFVFCAVYGVNRWSVIKKRIFRVFQFVCVCCCPYPYPLHKKQPFLQFLFCFVKSVCKTSANDKRSIIRRINSKMLDTFFSIIRLSNVSF